MIIALGVYAIFIRHNFYSIMRISLLLVLMLYMFSCKQKRSLAGDEQVAFIDLAEAFPVATLPYSLADSGFYKVADTSVISRAVFKQFVPDSVLAVVFGIDTSYTIRPVARLEEKEKEDYLAVYAKANQKATIVLLVFKDDKFSASLPLLTTNKDKMNKTITIDKKLSVIINEEWMEGDEMMYERKIMAYNTAGVFTTVLTETNVPPVFTASTVINPIDTFPGKNKYSGDYVKGKNNMLSIRDGKTPNDYLFFAYFVNEGNDECGGNIRGEVTLTSSTTGTFSSPNDPCVIDFTFSTNSIKIKETGSCGNYRGITCFFDHTFTKKKPAKAVVKKTD